MRRSIKGEADQPTRPVLDLPAASYAQSPRGEAARTCGLGSLQKNKGTFASDPTAGNDIDGLGDDPGCKSNVTLHREVSRVFLDNPIERLPADHTQSHFPNRRASGHVLLVSRTPPLHHVSFVMDDPVKGPHLNSNLSVRLRSNYQHGILGTRRRGGPVSTHTQTLLTWASPPGRLGNGHPQYSARRT
ncbi:uncharacterized protein LY79DRAFT_188396 [Colletotrichum navitas]|uniref:Uncharacterized protein n=1 Tax=Colletotrichum navitas TaxID=681940 RepID=A0AAD8PZQ3_9PEZI|nr:uncharacterized protein LY79DRAFT_188396 [Colletotrichum navitas]KAK1593130.1 hypothetical protein LY79DRAFT_188396 [Colletotrichum navitas]